MVTNILGITCKKCKRNESELESLGIAMNIALETCNECLKAKKTELAHADHAAAVATQQAEAPQYDSCRDLHQACLALLGSFYVGEIQVNECPPALLPHIQVIKEILRK